MIPTPRPALELALLGLLALLWGSSYLWIHIAIVDLPPVTLIAARVATAALVLSAVLVWRGQKLPRLRRTWFELSIQSIINSVAPWTMLAWGQQYVPSSLAGVLNSTSPIFVVLLTLVWFRHERLAPLRIAGAVLGLCGVSLVIGLDAFASVGERLLPQLAVLGGAVLYAGAAIYGTRFNALPPLTTATGAMICASAMLVPASLVLERPWTLSPSVEAIAATAILGVFCTGLALMIYFRLVRTLGSLGTTSQAYLRSSVSVVLGTLVVGEQLTPLIAIGLATTIIGVALINRRR